MTLGLARAALSQGTPAPAPDAAVVPHERLFRLAGAERCWRFLERRDIRAHLARHSAHVAVAGGEIQIAVRPEPDGSQSPVFSLQVPCE